MRKQSIRFSIGAAVLVATLFILIIGSVSSEAIICGVIKGVVTDKRTGDPLPSVAVQIVGTTMGKLTDTQGKYTIETVEPGKYSLTFRLVGYQTIQVAEVKVIAGDTAEVSVEMSRTTMETGTVQTCTGARDVMHMELPRSSCMLGPTDAAMSSPMAHGGTTPPNAEPYDAMFFKHYGVNPFVDRGRPVVDICSRH